MCVSDPDQNLPDLVRSQPPATPHAKYTLCLDRGCPVHHLPGDNLAGMGMPITCLSHAWLSIRTLNTVHLPRNIHRFALSAHHVWSACKQLKQHSAPMTHWLLACVFRSSLSTHHTAQTTHQKRPGNSKRARSFSTLFNEYSSSDCTSHSGSRKCDINKSRSSQCNRGKTSNSSGSSINVKDSRRFFPLMSDMLHNFSQQPSDLNCIHLIIFCIINRSIDTHSLLQPCWMQELAH